VKILRSGVLLGNIKGKRFVPSHHIYTSGKAEEFKNVLNLKLNSDELHKYLHGEEIPCNLKGYTLVCVEDIPLGGGKASGGKLKNHYPKGLRNLT
jgi:NOL1/NOP2/fmu family ribosome biogenesis protein